MATLSVSNLKADKSFFDENFVNYDLDKQAPDQDFTGLEEAQVICIGEIHHTDVLDRLEQEAVRRLAQDVSCCVQLESLLPGQVSRGKSGWVLPKNVTFHGSDIRSSNVTSEQYDEFSRLHQKMVAIGPKIKETWEATVRHWAQCLNGVVSSNPGSIDEKEQALIVPASTVDSLDHATWMSRINSFLDQHEEYNNFIASVRIFSKLQLKESNEGLIAETLKSCQQYARVISIWGQDHYLFGEEIFDKLKEAGIKFRILLPNEKRYVEAKTENLWRTNAIEKLSLKLSYADGIAVIKIPQDFQSFFHPSIQALFSVPFTPAPTVLNSLQLLKLFEKEGSRIEFTPSRESPLHFEGANKRSIRDLTKAMIGLTFYLEESKKNVFDNCMQGKGIGEDILDQLCEEPNIQHLALQIPKLLSIGINEMLLLGNRKLKEGLIIKGAPWHPYPHYEKFGFEFLNGPMVLEVVSGQSEGAAAHLLREMKKYNVDFEMKPKSSTTFTDISPKELTTDETNPQFLVSWLNARAPAGTLVLSEGQVKVSKLTAEKKLHLETDTGFKLSLKIPTKP